jgi:hypothetical protein
MDIGTLVRKAMIIELLAAIHRRDKRARSSWPGIAVRRTASLPLACVPAIHVFGTTSKKDVDARVKPGHDGVHGADSA